MKSPLQRFFERLIPPATSADPDAALDAAGVDQWSAETSPIDHVERSGLVDPRGGGQVRMTEFPALLRPPASYPADWPFLPEQEALLAEISLPEGDARIMFWSEVANLAVAYAALQGASKEAGWTHHPYPDGAPEPPLRVPHYIAWFRRAGAMSRLLSVGQFGGESVLMLTEGPPELIWSSDEAERHGAI